MKLSLFADDMKLYIENPKDATRKLLGLINEFGKVAGYKINAQKSLAFLHTNDEKSKREIKKSVTFTIATKRLKCLVLGKRKMDKEVVVLMYNGISLSHEINVIRLVAAR